MKADMSKCKPETILSVGDLHAPFMHRDAVRFLEAVKSRHRPTQTVFLGDVADQHALSRFTRNPSGLSCGHEIRAARRQLKPVGELFPEAAVCWGNHDRRVYDRAAEVGIPEETILGMNDILKCPAGWEWRDRWEIAGVVFEHGTGWSGKDAHIKAATANMGPTVIGHIHAHAAVSFVANRKHLFYGFNVGCLIDHEAYAFAYAKVIPAKPIIGVGLIECGVPRFVPMVLSRGGRWVGKL
jgi:predicted phosphodiesterase